MTMLPPGLKEDARLSYAISCWHRWRGHRPCPMRSDLDPLDFKQLLPNLFLVEQLPADGDRFRYVLSGETVRNTLGFELSGRYLDDLFTGEMLARAQVHYRSVLAGNGHFTIQQWMRRGALVLEFRRLLLPLIGDSGRIDTVMGLGLYDRSDGMVGRPVDHVTDPVTIVQISDCPIPLNAAG
jgi:hypothetical protein